MARSRTHIATPPGATIREQLQDRCMSQKEFAIRMNLSEKHVSKLINGEVQLTPEMAVRLETVLGVPAHFWSNLEAIYREKLVKVEAENSMESDERVARDIPYAQMVEYGWIPDEQDVKKQIARLRAYFEVVQLNLICKPQITRIACRHLDVTEKEDLAFLVWVQEARKLSRGMEAASVDLKKLDSDIGAVREMAQSADARSCAELQSALASCGVTLVILPPLSESSLQGVTFLDGSRIVIGLRSDLVDSRQFSLNLFHELAHILLGHIYKIDGTTDEDERAADAWAREKIGI